MTNKSTEATSSATNRFQLIFASNTLKAPIILCVQLLSKHLVWRKKKQFVCVFMQETAPFGLLEQAILVEDSN